LLIRVVAGTVLIINGVMQVHVGQPVLPMLLGILAIGDGALLLAGLWTPLAGVLAAVLSTVDIIFRHENLYPGILLVAMGAGLTLVGPGAISIDSRIFGLRKIDLEKLDEPSRR
jgi:putative oxidoreductase